MLYYIMLYIFDLKIFFEGKVREMFIDIIIVVFKFL